MLNESTIFFSSSPPAAHAASVVNAFAIPGWGKASTRTILAAFVLSLGLNSAARAEIVYETTVASGFGTIDLNTGAFTALGPTNVQLAGLGEIGSLLYGASYAAGNGTLYTVNTANGSLSAVGVDNTVSYAAFGSTLTSLYGLDNIGGIFDLYSINSTTGKSTLIGSTGLAPGGDYTLSTNSSTLYFAEGADLYTLNTGTGLATLVGATGGVQFGGLVTVGTTLYGGEYNPALAVDTLSTVNGAATVGPSLSPNNPADAFAGLAPIPATTPEPGSGSLLLIGLVAAGGWSATRSSGRISKRKVG